MQKKVDSPESLSIIAAMQKRYYSGFKKGNQADICAEYPNLWPVVDYGGFVCGAVIALCPSEFEAINLASKLNFFEELKRKHLPSSEI